MQELLEAGVHFGHRTKIWNPRMAPYIFLARNGLHILDLEQTVTGLQDACAFAKDIALGGGTILFVGTKKQAREAIETEAVRCGMPYIAERWMGGMLTNLSTILLRVSTMRNLEMRRGAGEFDLLPKKEAAHLVELHTRLERVLGGVREMVRLPDALFVIDTLRERTAILEARRLDIPIIALVDTNSNPDEVDYPIPANDDGVRANRLLAGKITDAILAGKGTLETRQKWLEKAEIPPETRELALETS